MADRRTIVDQRGSAPPVSRERQLELLGSVLQAKALRATESAQALWMPATRRTPGVRGRAETLARLVSPVWAE
jgi:hypothetical protein